MQQVTKQFVNAPCWLTLVLAVMLGASFLGGCEVGPNYRAARMSMPGHWQKSATTQQTSIAQEPVQSLRWWSTFNDPVLDSLITRAMASNLDLEAATQRIREARATVGVVRAGLLPTANTTGAYSRSGGAPGSGQDLWQAGLDASWELDFFGGTRRAVESANASLQAAVEDRRDVLVTLLREVCTDYISLRGFQQEIAIARQNLDVQIHSAQVARDKRKVGNGTQLDVAQADAIVASTRAALETQEASAQQTIYALSILVGLPPASLNNELTAPGKIPSPPAVMAVGLPSDLLRRRPDIRRAERQVAAATAQIGVATADLFPKFFLTGDFNFQASQFAKLTSWDSRSWSIGPSVSWPIFEGGRIRANIEVQNALQAQALTAYRSTVLSALQEVENAQVSYLREQRRRDALADAVAANQSAVQLATQRYNQGATDFLAVLDAERSLFASQDALVVSNRDVATDAVALYKALGGGWEADEEQTSDSGAATTPGQ